MATDSDKKTLDSNESNDHIIENTVAQNKSNPPGKSVGIPAYEPNLTSNANSNDVKSSLNSETVKIRVTESDENRYQSEVIPNSQSKQPVQHELIDTNKQESKETQIEPNRVDIGFWIDVFDSLPAVESQDLPALKLEEEEEDDDDQPNASEKQEQKYNIPYGYAETLFGKDKFTLYHTDDGNAFVRILSKKQPYSIPLGTSAVVDKMIYYQGDSGMTKRKRKDIGEACKYLYNLAMEQGQLIKLSPRIFREGDTVYYDLHDSICPRFVIINKEGFKLCDGSDLRFKSYDTQGPQVVPTIGGSLNFFDKYYNQDPRQCILLKVFLICAFIPGIKHPILLMDGERGSGKSTLIEILTSLVDPMTNNDDSATSEPLAMPIRRSDLYLNLEHHYFCAFDNKTEIKKDISNDLCQASTGLRSETRKNYKDDDMISRNFKRVVLINGKNLGSLKDDLLDRCIFLHFSRFDLFIDDIYNDFMKDRSLILGAVFSAISKALQIFPSIKLDRQYQRLRMVQFVKWGYACALALGEQEGERFLQAYHDCVDQQDKDVMDDDPLLTAITSFMNDQEDPIWEGSMDDLRVCLINFVKRPDLNYIEKMLPKTPSAYGRRLNETKENLRKHGILVETVSEGGEKRLRRLTNLKKIEQPITKEEG